MLNSLVRTDRGLNRVRLDRDNVAPRLGVAWTPFRDKGRTLVRAGAGVVYDSDPKAEADETRRKASAVLSAIAGEMVR